MSDGRLLVYYPRRLRVQRAGHGVELSFDWMPGCAASLLLTEPEARKLAGELAAPPVLDPFAGRPSSARPAEAPTRTPSTAIPFAPWTSGRGAFLAMLGVVAVLGVAVIATALALIQRGAG